MYWLLKPPQLGTARGPSTCINVRSALTPYGPVTHPRTYQPRQSTGAGAAPLLSDIFPRCDFGIGRPARLSEAASVLKCQHGAPPAVIQPLASASLPRRMNGWNQWRSFGTVTVTSSARTSSCFGTSRLHVKSRVQPQPHLTPTPAYFPHASTES